jgi:excisionase family DNA binding protein
LIMDEQAFISVAQAAAILGVSRWRINQLIASGRLPAMKIGRSYIIRFSDLSKIEKLKVGRPRKT